MNKSDLIAKLTEVHDILSAEKYNPDYAPELQRKFFFIHGDIGLLIQNIEGTVPVVENLPVLRTDVDIVTARMQQILEEKLGDILRKVLY